MNGMWGTLFAPYLPEWVVGLFFVVFTGGWLAVEYARERVAAHPRRPTWMWRRAARRAREQAPAIEASPPTPHERFMFRQAVAAAMKAGGQEPQRTRRR